MSHNLLLTKLFVPSLRPSLIPRPHLIQGLNAGLHGKLTLVSAPPGFGKTTLVSSWLKQCERPFTWLSLDKDDNEPNRFFIYLIAALQKIDGALGETAVSLLQSLQPPPPETLLTLLINDLATLPQPIILVLEDYHLIHNLDIHKALAFLLDNLPPQLHLAITSREDPPLPLHRLRSSGQMTGIYAHDLRFDLDEAADFLQQTMNVDLLPEDVAKLARRTEGWIAGLQLAALSLQGLPDAHEFVAGFAGDDRYVADYLLNEVIDRQPPHIQEFLLKTAVLDRFCPSLCEAILETPTNHSQETLTYLEDANLFIVPLDNKRQWYRYHHLFADFLRLRLRERPADEVHGLHRRAANWFETHELVDEAINHSLAGADYERACYLIENHARLMLWGQTQWAKLLNWVEALPTVVIRSRPRLGLQYAWTLVTVGNLQNLAPLLDSIEAILNDASETKMTKMQRGEINILRAWLAVKNDDMMRCVQLASLALEQLPKDAQRRRGLGLLALGSGYCWLGQLQKSRPYIEEAANVALAVGNMAAAMLAMGYLVQIEASLGNLRKAAEIYYTARQQGTIEGIALVNMLGKASNEMGEVLREWGQLQEAASLLEKGIQLCLQAGQEDNAIKGQMALVRVWQATGDEARAAEQLTQSESDWMRWVSGGSNNLLLRMRPAFVNRARYWLAIGEVAKVSGWLEADGIRYNDDAMPGNDARYLILARVLIARQQAEATHRLLNQLLPSFEHDGALRHTIEALVLLAIAARARGERDAAVQALARALLLAEPEGYQRIFLDDGEQLFELLAEVDLKGTTAVYAQNLRTAIQGIQPTPSTKGSISTTTPQKVAAFDEPEPLTEREEQILRFMAAGLTNKEIAAELYLSVNTIKTYSTRIYEKLGVHSRAEAVNLAHELGQL